MSRPLVGARIEALDERDLSRGRTFNVLSPAKDWGDGLPLCPPTEESVAELHRRHALAARRRHRQDRPEATAWRPSRRPRSTRRWPVSNRRRSPMWSPRSKRSARHDFNLFAVSTTTSSVMPMFIVNGPARDELGFDYGDGCMGGAAGRRVEHHRPRRQLCMRNIGGQKVGRHVEERLRSTRPVAGRVLRRMGGAVAVAVARRAARVFDTPRGRHRARRQGHAPHGRHQLRGRPRPAVPDRARASAFPIGNKFLEPTAAKGEIVVAHQSRVGQALRRRVSRHRRRQGVDARTRIAGNRSSCGRRARPRHPRAQKTASTPRAGCGSTNGRTRSCSSCAGGSATCTR